MVGLAFGLEYFTPWHFSVAAHSSLMRVTWVRTAFPPSLPGESRRRRDSESASIGLSPLIYVRGYF